MRLLYYNNRKASLERCVAVDDRKEKTMVEDIQEQPAAASADTSLPRRKFLGQLAGGALLTLAAPVLAYAHGRPHAYVHAGRSRFQANRALALVNPNTGENLRLTYFDRGRYVRPALWEINHLLRDYRTGDVHAIDVPLLDQLHDLQVLLGIGNRPFHVISGYRSPSTNGWLHHESAGVSSHSLHMQGRAVDVRIEGLDTRHLRNAAMAMGRGGVGYYRDSDFVHIDTGKFRNWQG